MTGKRAWLALALAASGCAPGPHPGDGRFPQALSGLGTEPFWSIEIDGARLRYASSDAPTPRTADLVRRETPDLLELTGTLAGQTVRASISRADCSDGMSDRTYPFTLELTLGNRTLRGCAYPRGARLAPA